MCPAQTPLHFCVAPEIQHTILSPLRTSEKNAPNHASSNRHPAQNRNTHQPVLGHFIVNKSPKATSL